MSKFLGACLLSCSVTANVLAGSAYIGASVNIVRDQYKIDNTKAVGDSLKLNELSNSLRKVVVNWEGTQNQFNAFIQSFGLTVVNNQGSGVPGLPLSLVIDWDGPTQTASFQGYDNADDVYAHIGESFLLFAASQSNGMLDVSTATHDFYVDAGKQILYATSQFSENNAPGGVNGTSDVNELAAYFVTLNNGSLTNNFFKPLYVYDDGTATGMQIQVYDTGYGTYDTFFQPVKDVLVALISDNIQINGGVVPPTTPEAAAATLASSASAVGIGGSIFAGYVAQLTKSFFLAGEFGLDMQDNTVGNSSKNEMIVRNGFGAYAIARPGLNFDPVSIYLNAGIGVRSVSASYQYLSFSFAESFMHFHYLLGGGVEARVAPQLGIFVEFNTKFNPTAKELSSFAGVKMKLREDMVRLGGRYYFTSAQPTNVRTAATATPATVIMSGSDSLDGLRRRLKELETRVAMLNDENPTPQQKRELRILNSKITSLQKEEARISSARVAELERKEAELYTKINGGK